MSAGAVGAAPVLCKEAGCSTIAARRRMCWKHYGIWSKANPGLRVNLLNQDLIEDMLPGRVTELAEKSGLTTKGVMNILAKLHEAGRAKIDRWDPPRCRGSRFTPVWIAGKGSNARKPAKKARKEHSYQAWHKARARRLGRYQPPPAACWTAALGIGE